MKLATSFLCLLAVLQPLPAAAQEFDVARRAYTFLDSHLDIAVIAEAAGTLQVVRGERGRVEVAARSVNGFPGFALGGAPSRQLRLTAPGAQAVDYLVIVPEHVTVRVILPGSLPATLPTGAAAGTYKWTSSGAENGAGSVADEAAPTASAASAVSAAPALPAASGGAPGVGAGPSSGTAGEDMVVTGRTLYVAHRSHWAPSLIDVPELASIRSVTLRFEGEEFRVAASRAMVVEPGSRSHLEIRVGGEPLHLEITVPHGQEGFVLKSGSIRLAESAEGRPRALCDSVAIQSPAPDRTWLTFYPQTGRLHCR
jgi:hypothetical protein